jgi:putative spermidine/putrescine transport system substrate-binding protein
VIAAACSGRSVRASSPSTSGWGVVRSGVHVIRNGENPEAAAAYVNEAISVDVQRAIAEIPYALVPTSVEVPMSKPLQQYAKTVAEVETFDQPDGVRYTPLRQAYIDRFNREFKVGA